MHLDYEVIDGSHDEIDVTVTDLDKSDVVFSATTPSARRDWSIDDVEGIKTRTFRVCFHNTVYMERKLVSFSWHLNQDELLKFAKADQIEKALKKKVDTLWEEVDTVKDMVHYFGLVQSQQHKSTSQLFFALCVCVCVCSLNFTSSHTSLVIAIFAANQDTNSRVGWSSGLEVISILTMTAMQIYVLKSFFERRQRV